MLVIDRETEMAGSGRQNLERLSLEQNVALKSTDQQLKQWAKFKDDYTALEKKLKELPDQITHKVMVPFGPLAFIPGQLIHTNEILVLLGDNWFAERSAKESCEIIGRRLQGINDSISNLEKQRQLLETRASFTQESLDDAVRGVTDITEEYDSEEEEKWREQHKKSVQKHRTQQKQMQCKTDEGVFARFEELELQETSRRELLESDSDADELSLLQHDSSSQSQTSDSHSSSLQSATFHNLSSQNTSIGTSKKSVQWTDTCQLPASALDEDNSSLDSDDSNNMEPVIHFKHSPRNETNSEAKPLSASVLHNSVDSPADIYRLFAEPKSILKQSESLTNTPGVSQTPPREESMQQRVNAVQDHVVENVSMSAHQVNVAQQSQPKQRVSKFKEMRMKK